MPTKNLKSITTPERATEATYKAAEPNQFGDLHERMKFLMATIKRYGEGGPHDAGKIPLDVLNAVYDLETEVKFYMPVNPPYGRRPCTRRM